MFTGYGEINRKLYKVYEKGSYGFATLKNMVRLIADGCSLVTHCYYSSVHVALTTWQNSFHVQIR